MLFECLKIRTYQIGMTTQENGRYIKYLPNESVIN
jgi:hypothetical protein